MSIVFEDKTWEEYGGSRCVHINYITGEMRCDCCGTKEVPGGVDNIHSNKAIKFRIEFEKEHSKCKNRV
jgi:hypothetical protein